MKLISNLRLVYKMALGFSVMLLFTFGIAMMGLNSSSKINTMLNSMYDDNLIPITDLSEANLQAIYHTRKLLEFIIETDVPKMQEIGTQMDKMKLEMASRINKYRKTDLTEPEAKLLKEVDEAWPAYENSSKRVEDLSLASKNDAAMAEYKNVTSPAFQNYENLLAKLVTMNRDLAKGAYDESDVLVARLNKIIYLALGIVFVLSVVIAVALVRSISRALGAEPSEINHAASRMAAGDVNFEIKLEANDNSSAMAAMRTMQGNVKLLISDANLLSRAAIEGKLSTRADASKHDGDFRKVVEGVNATLDSVIGPLNVAANYVDRISKGDIPASITETYNGDFNAIKNNLNACIDAVNKMAADAAMLSAAAVDGKLSTRADATKHQGDFRKIVEGVNHTLDAVIDPLNVAASYVDQFAKGSIPNKITNHYSGDFNIIKNNLNACVDALTLLVNDTNMLVQAAQADKLDTRADATKHWGDYRKVVEGVNGTLDTVMQKNAAESAEKAKEAQLLAGAVDETQSVIEGAKNGDLTSRVSLNGKTGAIAALCDGVNALMDKMTEVIVQVREAGDTINTAAGEISAGNNDLSQRTEQQASSLEETAASMEELASTVKNNAENAKQANQLAAAASSVAIKGGEAVGQVVSTMSAINSSAKKIEDIISVIDGIAFQTNILALNAAVEAARAGEQGRGFAVVAGEVRNLAQRSASAAKEIKELISDSVSKTAEGTTQVEQAGKTMQEIVSSVQRVTDIMGEITAASVEQSSGIDQVNQAVTSMDEVTQQNAALVEEAAAAAESLVEQAESLIDVVSAFKLSGGSAVSSSHFNSRAPVHLVASKPNLRAFAA